MFQRVNYLARQLSAIQIFLLFYAHFIHFQFKLIILFILRTFHCTFFYFIIFSYNMMVLPFIVYNY